MRPIFLLAFFLVMFLHASGQSHDWKLKKQTKNLKVYFRKSVDSRIDEIKIETEMQTSLSAIIALLRDVPAQKEWMYKCIEAKRIRVISDTEGYNYGKIDFPWPMSDRDYIVKGVIKQDSITGIVTSNLIAVPSYMKEVEGVVRIHMMEIDWKFTPLPGGFIKIENHIKSDPGGAMPAWLVNLAIEQGPIQSMDNLREMVKKDKYRNARLSFIAELRK